MQVDHFITEQEMHERMHLTCVDCVDGYMFECV